MCGRFTLQIPIEVLVEIFCITEFPSFAMEPLGKTSGKILDEVRQKVEITIPELSSRIGVTERSIERNIKTLHVYHAITPVGNVAYIEVSDPHQGRPVIQFKEKSVKTTMSEIIQCMSCGYEGMVREENRTETIGHAGESVTLTGLSGWFCPSCQDGWFDDADQIRYGKAGDELVQRSRERQSKELRRIRKKLGLTQKEAAVIFGGGVNAFSRYEKGEIEPNTSTRKLLHLLDKHPELLKEVVGNL